MSVKIPVQLYVAKSVRCSWRSGRVSCALHYGTLNCALLGCLNKKKKEEHKEGSVVVIREVDHLITSNSLSKPANLLRYPHIRSLILAKTQINDYVRWSSWLKQHITCKHTHPLKSSSFCISPFSRLSVLQWKLFTFPSIWASIIVNVWSDHARLSWIAECSPKMRKNLEMKELHVLQGLLNVCTMSPITWHSIFFVLERGIAMAPFRGVTKCGGEGHRRWGEVRWYKTKKVKSTWVEKNVRK